MENVKIELNIPHDVIISINKSTKELSEDIKYLRFKGYSLFNWDEEELDTEINAMQKIHEEKTNERMWIKC